MYRCIYTYIFVTMFHTHVAGKAPQLSDERALHVINSNYQQEQITPLHAFPLLPTAPRINQQPRTPSHGIAIVAPTTSSKRPPAPSTASIEPTLSLTTYPSSSRVPSTKDSIVEPSKPQVGRTSSNSSVRLMSPITADHAVIENYHNKRNNIIESGIRGMDMLPNEGPGPAIVGHGRLIDPISSYHPNENADHSNSPTRMTHPTSHRQVSPPTRTPMNLTNHGHDRDSDLRRSFDQSSRNSTDQLPSRHLNDMFEQENYHGQNELASSARLSSGLDHRQLVDPDYNYSVNERKHSEQSESRREITHSHRQPSFQSQISRQDSATSHINSQEIMSAHIARQATLQSQQSPPMSDDPRLRSPSLHAAQGDKQQPYSSSKPSPPPMTSHGSMSQQAAQEYISALDQQQQLHLLTQASQFRGLSIEHQMAMLSHQAKQYNDRFLAERLMMSSPELLRYQATMSAAASIPTQTSFEGPQDFSMNRLSHNFDPGVS